MSQGLGRLKVPSYGAEMTLRPIPATMPLACALLMAACSTTPQLPTGMKAGQFARMSCDGGRGFAVRLADDGRSARVRAMHGAVELSRQGDGVYLGEDYKLEMPASAPATLWHKGKVEADKCKAQTS
jgi:hypothetical protein